MGAMQAQNFAMAKWAIGVRLLNSTEHEINGAIDRGDIIRTHLLRPTWHFASASDVSWMLELTAKKVKASMKSRQQQLGLTEAIITKSNSIIEKALRGGKHLSRAELQLELIESGVAIYDNRLSHLLAHAELDGLICSGVVKNGEPAYALLQERVVKTGMLTRHEALAALAKKYFWSHSPATLQDFTWWSGLTISEATLALEMVKSELTSEQIDNRIYWIPQTFSLPRIGKDLVHLLPAFDEFIISYQDRSASLTDVDHKKAVSNNGIFRPTIVVNGQVMGIWNRTIKKDTVLIETELFKRPIKRTLRLVEKAAEQYGGFLELKTEILHKFDSD
jgi:hypothetical protein